MSSKNLAMDTKNFFFTYAGAPAPTLKNINMPIRDKKVTALIGPSGCGKSTLLRSWNRIHDVYPGNKYEGEVILYNNEDGSSENILTYTKEDEFIKLRQRVGMIFQKPTPFPMSIFDNVAYGLRLAGIKSKSELEGRVEKALKGSAIWDEGIKQELRIKIWGFWYYCIYLHKGEEMAKRLLVATLTTLTTMMVYGGAPSNDKELSLKIIHFNDHHGHLDETSRKLKIKGVGKIYTKIGGFPRIATMAKKLKKEGQNTLFLNAGDAFSGTLYHTLFHGIASATMLNELGIDAFELGNHEFDNRDEGLSKFIEKANYPILSCNTVAKRGNVLDGKWKPYLIKEINGTKVGIIGLEYSQKTKVSSRPSDDISFLDEASSVQKYVDKLEAEGVNKIILLSHFGYKNDLDLISKIRGVDVVIDGDSHTLMGDFSDIGLKSQVSEYPKHATDKNGKPVCIAQAWAHALVLGDLDIVFDANGTLKSCKGVPHLLFGSVFKVKNKEKKKVEVNATTKKAIEEIINSHDNLSIVAPDSNMTEILSHYKQLVDQKKNDPIGSASEDIKHIRIPGHDYGGISGANMPLGSDLAPVVAKGFYDASLRADLCIQNAGGVRTSIKSGNVSYGDAYTILPFSNTLFEIDMKGESIKNVLEDAISNFKDNDGSTGSFPYAYGIKYDIDMTKAKGDRVSGLEVMDRKTKKWSTLDMNKTYVVVTNNYIAEGRDGYTTFKTVQKNGAKAIDTQLDYAESFVNYVKGLAKQGKGLTKLPAQEHCIKSYKE